MEIKLSACTIAKNEALNIGKSIDSYKDVVDEIIIVDTGSIDETAKIAEEKGAKVLKFEWKNDFSAAKNFALENATGDWIIFLDADEWFDGDSAKNIKQAIEVAISRGYDAVACKLVNFFTETEIMETASTMRVFKKADNIRFCRAIHEALFNLDTDCALPGLYSELFTVNHSGYMKDLLEKKAKRNKKLLDKNFALGNMNPIDYFYGMRENLKEDKNMSEYFYKLIENTPNYDELVSAFNITTSVDENKIKVVNSLPEKYSFDYRSELLKSIQQKYPNNPYFKFFEYMLFEKIDKKKAIEALQVAVDSEKNLKDENLLLNNPFYGKRGEVNTILGEYYIFVNDKIKALEYFSAAIKAEYNNVKALYGILHVVSNEKSEDIILFLNSIFDLSNQDVEKYLVDSLRLTEFKDVFLYYFVDYYKKFEEVEVSYFTSRLITGNFDEVIDKYLEVYKDVRDEKAILLISTALIMKNSKEKFYELKDNIKGTSFKILEAYFEDKSVEISNDNELGVFLCIFKELAYIADESVIYNFLNLVLNVKEKVFFEAIKYYYSQYSYDYVLRLIEKIAKNNKELNNKLAAYENYLLTNIYFRKGDFDKIPDCLDVAVSKGFLDESLVLLCDILEADDEKLHEYFDMFDALCFARKNMPLKKLEDSVLDTVKFMTIDKFNEEIKNRKISLLAEHQKIFFDFAEKAKGCKAWAIAERYYKLLVKYDYKIDKAYFALGEIYNRFGKPELSYFCYENAFVENVCLTKDILGDFSDNSNYIFSKKSECEKEICPVCGGTSKLKWVYPNIYCGKLSYNEPLIAKYRCCDECEHIFRSNEIKDKIFWEDEEENVVSDDKISLYYDILEDVCEITDGDTVLECDGDNIEFETAAQSYGFHLSKKGKDNKFDIVFVGNALNDIYDITDKLYEYVDHMSQNGIIIFQFYDEGNAFSKLHDRPFWVRTDVKNIFSSKAIELLFKNAGLSCLQLNVDNINKGQIIVFAGK